MLGQQLKLLSTLSQLLLPRKQLALPIIVVLAIWFWLMKPEQVIAATEFTLNPKSRIEAVLGAGGVNRIQVSGSEVMEVVGDESKYSLYWSYDWRNLFITPKTEVGETVNLSLILIDGQAQDFRFTVGDLDAQTILLTANNLIGDNKDYNITTMTGSSNSYLTLSPNLSSLTFSKALKMEIASMMRAMIEDAKSKYYVNVNKRTLLKNKEMLITQSKSYRYKDLSGAVLNIKNLSSREISLDEWHVSNLFKDVIAINLSSSLLFPRSKVAAYVITRGNQEER